MINSDRVNNITSYYALMLWNTIINTFSLASSLCHRRRHHHPHRSPHDNHIPGPSFLLQIKSCHPLSPIPTADCVFWGGLIGAQHWDPLVKIHPLTTFDCRLLVVHRFRCYSHAPSARFAAPGRGHGGGASWHLPLPGSSFSSLPCYSCPAESQQSATWLMINATGC
jgi:hypothetical protein